MSGDRAGRFQWPFHSSVYSSVVVVAVAVVVVMLVLYVVSVM
jgi:hypothetical protein